MSGNERQMSGNGHAMSDPCARPGVPADPQSTPVPDEPRYADGLFADSEESG